MSSKENPQKTGKNKGGRPRQHVDLGKIEFRSCGQPVVISMADRKQVEEFCERQISDLQSDYDQILADIDTILGALKTAITKQSEAGKIEMGILKAMEGLQQRRRQVCNDKAAMLSMLMKQYELFSALDKPTEDDPLYTPVLFEMAEPQAEALVEPHFELEEDDIEPDTA